MDDLTWGDVFHKAEELFNDRHQIIMKILLDDCKAKSHSARFNALMKWLADGKFTDSYQKLRALTALIIGMLYYEDKI